MYITTVYIFKSKKVKNKWLRHNLLTLYKQYGFSNVISENSRIRSKGFYVNGLDGFAHRYFVYSGYKSVLRHMRGYGYNVVFFVGFSESDINKSDFVNIFYADDRIHAHFVSENIK